MNWIEALYQTYENCSENIGNPGDSMPLLPIAHIPQNTHIEITIDQDGKFQNARVEPFITIIPCTEASAGRTNSPEAHPLSDKLKYIASDFFPLTGENPKKPSKKGDIKSHHQEYIKQLDSWAASPHAHPKLIAIRKYLKSIEGRIMADLCRANIYSTSELGTIPKKWKGAKDSIPAIYASTKNHPAPWDIFVRWRVQIPGDLEDRTYFDRTMWDQWIAFYASTPSKPGLCYTTGNQGRLASNHPKRIRSIADAAKLISSNDNSGFTFRGRFTDKDGDQVCGVSFDVTQKAHNALRWLIARQGRRDGGQAIVAWAISGKNVPLLAASTDKLFDDEDDYLNDAQDNPSLGLAHAEVGQDFALRLKKMIGGYVSKLGNNDMIVVMALDSATPGRMSITYYRELATSEFLERIERWHHECAWFQNLGKDRKFIGAPAPKDIAQCAHGTRLDNKLQASTQRRLLRCIIDGESIPRDLVNNCIRRASARQSVEHWEWERTLGIACSLYRKNRIENNKHIHTMSLERDRTTRDYLYGRLLAVADHIESCALRRANEKRDTNAARLMQRFADRPYTTWRTIELSLDPYRRRLHANAPGLLHIYSKEIDEIMGLFKAEHFKCDTKLEGEFLLAYHTQRTALWTKQPKESEKTSDENE